MKLWRLEALRGLTAFYVFLTHTFGEASVLMRFGQEAVMVFFVLSGFVIEYSTQKSRDKGFANYFLKRFLRIYSILIMMFLLVSLIKQPDCSDFEFWKVLVGNLLMLQDFGTAKPNVVVPTLYSSALWSLHYEWWFYMAYYPIAFCVKKERQIFYVSIAGVLGALVYTIDPNFIVRLIMYFPTWWVGVELARLYMREGKINFKDMTIPLLFMIVISSILGANVIIYVYNGNHFSLGIHPILEFRHTSIAVCLVLAAIAWQKIGWYGFSILRVGTLIAPVSYALYISHVPLFVHADYFEFIGNPVFEKLGYLIVLLAFCWFAELKLYPWLKQRIRKIPKST